MILPDFCAFVPLKPEYRYSDYLATGYSESTIALWKLRKNPLTEFKVKGHIFTVKSVAFSPNSQYFATGSGDGIARLWNLKGNLLAEFKGHKSAVTSIVFDPNGQYIATNDGRFRGWDLKGNLITETKRQSRIGSIIKFNYKYIVTDGYDHIDQTWKAQLWDFKWNLLAEFNGIQGMIKSVAFSPDGKYLAIGSGDGIARLWDLKGNLLMEFQGHKLSVDISLPVIVSPDGKNLLTDSYIKTFQESKSSIDTVEFSPDGKYLATGSDDSTAKLWDLKGNLLADFKGHKGAVKSVAFSPNGQYFATGSEDKTARLWDLKGNLLAEFKGHQKDVNSVAFSPNGKYLATGSDDDTAKFWKIEELPDLLARGCDWLSDYLSSHPDDPQAREVREICKNY